MVNFVKFILLVFVFLFFMWLGISVGLRDVVAFLLACAGTLLIAAIVKDF